MKVCTKKLMFSYVKDVENSKQQTTITEFIRCARHLLVVKERTIPPKFKKIILEHNIDPDAFTLAQLDVFRKEVFESFLLLSECVFLVYRIKYG